MKRLNVIILLLIIILAESINAQIIKSFGIKIGASNSEQRWNYSPGLKIDESHISSIWGYDIGLFLEYFNMPYISFISEIHYIQRGRTVTALLTLVSVNSPQGYIDVGPQKIKQRFNYLSIPILAKLRIDNPYIIPYISIGPSFNILVSHPSSDVYDKFNKTEHGLNTLVGINIPYGILSQLIIEFSYQQSLTNSYKNENVTVYNKGYVFSIGLML